MVRINVTLNVTLSDCSPSTRDYVRTDGRQSRPKGGIRTFGARVWFFLYSFGEADLLSESGVRGGLDPGRAPLSFRADAASRNDRHRAGAGSSRLATRTRVGLANRCRPIRCRRATRGTSLGANSAPPRRWREIGRPATLPGPVAYAIRLMSGGADSPARPDINRWEPKATPDKAVRGASAARVRSEGRMVRR